MALDRRELIESALEASENNELEAPVDAPAELPVEDEIKDEPLRNEKGQFVAKEEAERSWEEKEKNLKRSASMVMSDIGGYISQVDGSWIESRSKHRDHLKRHGMIELGNDAPTKQKVVELSRKSQEQRKRTIAEIAYSKLRY